MGAVTYPNSEVVSFLNERFACVRLHIVEHAQALEPYAVCWTPALLVLDADGRQHRRAFGFHEPKDFIAELALGRLTGLIEREDWDGAKDAVREALERTRGDREREAEARYWKAVVTYKTTHDGLIAGWKELVEALPGTAWARKAEAFV